MHPRDLKSRLRQHNYTPSLALPPSLRWQATSSVNFVIRFLATGQVGPELVDRTWSTLNGKLNRAPVRELQSQLMMREVAAGREGELDSTGDWC